jgi:hypothetical protein
MLTRFALLAIVPMVLMSHPVYADISTEKSAYTPRAVGTGRSRPRRQDLASDDDTQAGTHTPIPLNNKDSRGVLYTVEVEVAGVSLPVLVCFIQTFS